MLDIAVIGAGAAGLFAAIWAARTAPQARVAAFDGATKLGAKILVAGGGRCNVTHHVVDERAFTGSTPGAIKKVLRAFTVDDTIAFFERAGVALKQEPTGKLFPVSDQSRSVLDALLAQARHAGVTLHHPARVLALDHDDAGFRIGLEHDARIRARRVIVATGGMALPKSGSDGSGYSLVRGLGHSTTARIFPALVPLTLAAGHPLTRLPGVAADVELSLHTASGKRLLRHSGPLLCTHFGISGPVVLDISRHYLDAYALGLEPTLRIRWIPDLGDAELDRRLLAGGRTGAARRLQQHGLSERLARALCETIALDPSTPLCSLDRTTRRRLVQAIGAFPIAIAGHRGFTHAEVTAGGVPLSELRLASMESRLRSGLHLCGEILDVDGRIGGFNFQWAWSSGYLAGVGAATSDPSACHGGERANPHP